MAPSEGCEGDFAAGPSPGVAGGHRHARGAFALWVSACQVSLVCKDVSHPESGPTLSPSSQLVPL